MEKNPKTLGSRPNPSAVQRPPRNFNLKQQQDEDHDKSLRRSRSFCGRPSQTQNTSEASSSLINLKTNTMMRRPQSHPELRNEDDPSKHPVFNTKIDHPKEANKLLVNVTTARSIGHLRLLLSADATVEDVIKATLFMYAKEGRRPLLSNDPASFGLHYSQFSIHALKPADNIKDLGSRKFFLCAKDTANESSRSSFEVGEMAASSSCGREVQKFSIATDRWYNKLRDSFRLSYNRSMN